MPFGCCFHYRRARDRPGWTPPRGYFQPSPVFVGMQQTRPNKVQAGLRYRRGAVNENPRSTMDLRDSCRVSLRCERITPDGAPSPEGERDEQHDEREDAQTDADARRANVLGGAGNRLATRERRTKIVGRISGHRRPYGYAGRVVDQAPRGCRVGLLSDGYHSRLRHHKHTGSLGSTSPPATRVDSTACRGLTSSSPPAPENSS